MSHTMAEGALIGHISCSPLRNFSRLFTSYGSKFKLDFKRVDRSQGTKRPPEVFDAVA